MIKPEYTLQKDTGKFLRSARIQKSWTGSELGKLMGVSQQQVSRYERGLTNLTLEALNLYLRILDKDWSEYFQEVIYPRLEEKKYV